MFELKYYNQANLWNKEPEAYQIQVLADILSLIPENIASILDVGCGDGFVTNALPNEMRVVGLDSSEEALKSVIKEHSIGSITDIPFTQKSFDLVMANDVIEHLPEEVYLKGVYELFRVAEKFVLITVPHAEQIEKSFAKCADCGYVYHINHHQRSFREGDLIDLCPQEWEVIEVRYSGDITRPPLDPTLQLQHEIQIYSESENCVCPNCGSITVTNHSSPVSQKILGKLKSERFFKNTSLLNRHINRSEIIVLYKRKDVALNSTQHSKNVAKEEYLSPLFLDLNNSWQQVKTGFVEGCFWSKHIINQNTDETDTEVQSKQSSIQVYFPTIPNAGDKILVQLTSHLSDSSSSIKVLAHDDLRDKIILLADIHSISSDNIEIIIDKPWNVNIFGAAVSLIYSRNIQIKSLQYISLTDNLLPFVHLEVGHNIFRNHQLPYQRSWGLFTKDSGYYPKPEWLWADNLTPFYDLNFMPVSILDYQQVQEELLHAKEELLHAKEELMKNLSSLLESTELNRTKAENAYTQASKHELFFFQSRKRSVNRVLVLSHMFPCQNQANLGCFVAEQVKALREFEGLDVRVVSCQPFWINTKNPLRFASAIQKYQAAVDASNWFLHEGIPTLFIPYIVGQPFVPFHLHGFSYRNAIAKVAKRIRRDFNFDLVHAHTGYLDGFAGLYLSSKYQLPLVITEHTGPFRFLTNKPIVCQITVKSLASADQVICVSPTLASQVKSSIPTSTHHKLLCLPNGVDINMFHSQESNDDAVNRNHIKLLSVISLDSNKNPFCLLEAFKFLRKDRINAELKIVGGGELKKKIEDWITNNGFTKEIQLLNWQPRQEVARLMQEECDILVLPSRSETFGVVVVEALASGKPVVSTRCGGPESIITQAYLGELCENENPLALAMAIEKVGNNLEKYPAHDIRQFAVENYSFERLAMQLSQLYQNL
ncbi:glycosyltransferase [Mastigocoleus sp. MO_188.B34]|uniref:glycosyltransferase n=1 Tax=Mastigocoleus sp. MO_188.B34 TaxID=3036635 RepID=UPI00260BEF56|nr:glycosyltransferase [Mastigocoleus sp. MO_188.B34]MDJ0694075.1 glycosyltransferase [Mastigocoleus sp. MO_188.B34]